MISDDVVIVSHPVSVRPLWFGEQNVDDLRTFANVVLNHEDRVLTSEEIVKAAKTCRIIILDRQTEVTAELMDGLPDLLAVLRGGVDLGRVDVDAASARGILIARVRAGYAQAVSELVIGMIIDAARSITNYAHAFRNGKAPDVISGQQISGSTVGIIGYGVISRYLAKVLDAMGAHVLVHDPYVTSVECGELVNMDRLLSASDYVVPLAPATPETANMIDAAALSRMKQRAWLINCSRGDLVDEEALLAALEAGDLAGAALDVGRAADQMPSAVLAKHPRVIATPHVGGITVQSINSHGAQSVEQARQVLLGRVPEGAVNAEFATRLVDSRR